MSSAPNTPKNTRDTKRKLLRSSGIYKMLPQSPKVHYPQDTLPLESPANKERLQALAESLSQLETNMGDIAKIHSAVNSGFNEPFAGFLYGLLITMFCNNFPGCPTRETYENNQDNGQESRTQALKERIKQARAENQRLKQRIATKTAETRSQAGRSELFALRTPVRRPISAIGDTALSSRRRKVTVAHDDTFSTTDSFVEVPASSVRNTGRAQRPGTAAAARQSSLGVIPNLDQPPRYMRGLFDKSGQSNMPRRLDSKSRARGPLSGSARRQAERASRLAGRAPFR